MLKWIRTYLTGLVAIVHNIDSLVAPSGRTPTTALAETRPKRCGVPHLTMNRSPLSRSIGLVLVLLLASPLAFTATPVKKRHHYAASHEAVVHAAAHPAATHAVLITRVAVTGPSAPVHKAVARTSAPAAPVIAGGPWTEPTYADSTLGDQVDGEDLDVRRAAVEALGQFNGSVVVVDPSNGRILAMVNQRVALGSGFQPCSTIKVSVALAGLSEKVIQPANKFRVGALKMDLTYALAHSNNFYFASLGE